MKLRAHCLLWMLLAAGLAGSPVQADIVPALYEARVPVADQSPDARKLALQQAFATVLMRITGERVLGGSLSLLSTNASQYLQQYRYEQAPPQVGAPPLGAAGQQPQSATQGATPPGFLLWARFDAKVVNKAVQDAHAPLWGAERPTTVVGLALQDGPTGRILSAADTSFVMQGLAAAADARGLTLVFPQMDAADKAAIGVPDVSG
ncbi:MAG TPA: DUF2066 domain-containing protein, partial [Gammaproteobacteria bacterium]|nr:DUF2066 domain-containing protein [Gammaproteobacteria bacterium]